jgi:hypothetical protein
LLMASDDRRFDWCGEPIEATPQRGGLFDRSQLEFGSRRSIGIFRRFISRLDPLNSSAFRLQCIQASIVSNRVEPRAEGRITSECLQALMCPHECLLQDVLGKIGILHHAETVAIHASTVRIHECGQGDVPLVTLERFADRLFVVDDRVRVRRGAGVSSEDGPKERRRRRLTHVRPHWRRGSS